MSYDPVREERGQVTCIGIVALLFGSQARAVRFVQCFEWRMILDRGLYSPIGLCCVK
jgi:hypothetical protein